MVYNSTDGWSDPAKTTQRFPCLTEDLMPRAKMGCRICGGAAASGLRICPDCRKAIGRPVLRCAGIVAVLALAAVGGYRLLRAPQPSAPQKPPDFRLPTRPPDSPPQQAATQSHQEATSSGSFFPQTSLVEPARRAPLSPDMSAPQNTLIAGQFVTAITQDRQGNMWFGSEEYGVVRFTKDGERTHFTSKHGLGDDNGYALVADADNNIWVGTLNHGLSKYDGKTWTTYSLLDGLGGLRVYCLAASPDGKTIWCGHENGVTRFDGKTWRWFSLADGLPWREITAVAAGKDGTAWVGGAMGGLGYFDGNTWTRFGKEKGLPDERINGLCLASDGRLWIATCKGVALYEPGRQGFEQLAPPAPETFGPDSHVTCVAEDKMRFVWFGTRRGGLVRHEPQRKLWDMFSFEQRNLPDNYVNCLYLAGDGHLWLAVYGYGICTSKRPRIAAASDGAPEETPGPSSASMLFSLDEESFGHRILAMSESSVRPAHDRPVAAYIGEDWETQGDWIGNYGRYFYALAGMGYPWNFEGGTGSVSTKYKVLVGENRRNDLGMAVWVHWRHTQKMKCLLNPLEEDRRQADWDDRGEAYSIALSGPNLYINLAIKEEGSFRLALYFVNKDAHELKWQTVDGHPGANRFRDYEITIKEWTPAPKETHPDEWPSLPYEVKEKGWMIPEDEYDAQPTLASCRLRWFAGGVYKRFAVTGPGIYRVRVARGASHNTICSGLFVDRMLNGHASVASSRAPVQEQETQALDAIHKAMRSSIQSGCQVPSIDEFLYLVPFIKKAMGRVPSTAMLRLLVEVIHDAGFPKTELAAARRYAAMLYAETNASADKNEALRRFKLSCDDICMLHFHRGEMPRECTRTSTRSMIRDVLWQGYLETLVAALPEDRAKSMLEGLALAYVGPPAKAPICEKAVLFLEREIKTFKHTYPTMLIKAMNLSMLGRYAESVNAYRQCVELTSDIKLKASCYERMAHISIVQLQDVQTGLIALEALLELAPGSREAQTVGYWMCIQALTSSDREKAVETCLAFLARNPDDDLADAVKRKMDLTKVK